MRRLVLNTAISQDGRRGLPYIPALGASRANIRAISRDGKHWRLLPESFVPKDAPGGPPNTYALRDKNAVDVVAASWDILWQQAACWRAHTKAFFNYSLQIWELLCFWIRDRGLWWSSGYLLKQFSRNLWIGDDVKHCWTNRPGCRVWTCHAADAISSQCWKIQRIRIYIWTSISDSASFWVKPCWTKESSISLCTFLSGPYLRSYFSGDASNETRQHWLH